jgi:hypothetical protein
VPESSFLKEGQAPTLRLGANFPVGDNLAPRRQLSWGQFLKEG